MTLSSPTESDIPSAADVVRYLRGLQNSICAALENIEAKAAGKARFQPDAWTREEGGGGESRVLSDGVIFERAGVNFSDILGTKLPPAATAARPELIGRGYRAMGVSLVIHPRNPYVPTSHMNVRFLIAEKPGEESIWWFGGGFDLTPYYGFDEDAQHWHRTAQAACALAGAGTHAKLKKQCDDYFYLKHRKEPRGLGGLFYDDWSEGGFAASFALMRSVGDHFVPAYVPIVERRQDTAYGERERNWQLVRRGRYVEFNLVWDRGTLFGLQSNGRIESILMSMPPMVSWQYRHEPAAGSAEAALMSRYLVPADWL